MNVEPVIASETSIQLAIAKYYSGSSEIDIFDAAFAVEVERNGVSSNGNGNGNGNVKMKHGPKVAAPEERITSADLDVSLDRFEFDGGETEEFEVVEDNDEIDLAALARASEDAPVVRLVNVLLVDSVSAAERRIFTSSRMRKIFASGSVSTACSMT